jgi:hypothetical protein
MQVSTTRALILRSAKGALDIIQSDNTSESIRSLAPLRAHRRVILDELAASGPMSGTIPRTTRREGTTSGYHRIYNYEIRAQMKYLEVFGDSGTSITSTRALALNTHNCRDRDRFITA